jgi:hypothetical protein
VQGSALSLAVIHHALERLDLPYPTMTPDTKADLQRVRTLLVADE